MVLCIVGVTIAMASGGYVDPKPTGGVIETVVVEVDPALQNATLSVRPRIRNETFGLPSPPSDGTYDDEFDLDGSNFTLGRNGSVGSLEHQVPDYIDVLPEVAPSDVDDEGFQQVPLVPVNSSSTPRPLNRTTTPYKPMMGRNNARSSTRSTPLVSSGGVTPTSAGTRGQRRMQACYESVGRSRSPTGKAPANDEVVNCMYQCFNQLSQADIELKKKKSEVAGLTMEVARVTKEKQSIESKRLYLKVSCVIVAIIVSALLLVLVFCL